MKTSVILLGILCSYTLQLNAQNCQTEGLDSSSFEAQPWIGNNQMLYDLADSVSQLAISIENTSGYEGGFEGSVVHRAQLMLRLYYMFVNRVRSQAVLVNTRSKT